MPIAEVFVGQDIVRLPTAAGWSVQAYKKVDPSVNRGIAIRRFELTRSLCSADYLLHMNDYEFAQKVASCSIGATPEDLVKTFRTSYNSRIALTNTWPN